MDNKDDFFDDKEKKKLNNYYEEDEEKRRYPSFILLCLITTFGVMLALGLSISAVKFMDSNQTINTIISRLTGDDNSDKYIITYIEDVIDSTSDGKNIIRNGKIHITDAKFDSATKGSSGEVIFYGGILMTTKNTFSSKDSKISYLVTLKNDSSSMATFYGLIYNPNDNVKYSYRGIELGDKLAPGETISIYVDVEYNGSKNISFPTTIESSINYDFQEDSIGLHITDANFNKDKSKNGGKGEVIKYEGLNLTTRNTFDSSKSTVTYQVTVKNDSPAIKYFQGLNYNENENIKYTYSDIKIGDKLAPGQSVTFDITVEYNGKDNNFPTTIESSVDYNFKDGGIHISDASFDRNKSTGDGKGEVIYYEGLLLTTKNTFENSNSKVAYEVTIKNSSEQSEVFDELIYNPDGPVKWSLVGIKNGDVLNPGESVKVYIILEPNNNSEETINYPTTIEASMDFDFSSFTVSESNGIYLLNQFPTKDEVGKLFEGTNYVFNWTLMVGKKTKGAYYEITAVPDKTNTLDPSYVKLYLEKNGKGVDFSYKNNKVKKFTDYLNSEHSEATGKVIYKGTITEEDAKSGKIEFKMRMWVSEDVQINESNLESFNNKKFAVKVNVYAQFNEGDNNE